jgi:PilZ domain
MFKRTVSFLRRLVGGKEDPSAEQSPPESEDRRVRVRYPSNVEVNFEPLNGSAGPRLSARVRNISLSGVNLLVNRPFQPGDLLSIELPAAEGRANSTVLACVVHASAQDGEWAVGCTFSHELSDEDLQPFGAKRERPSTPDDARSWVRFPVNVTAVCQEAMAPNQPPWPVQVLNISSSGIGMLVSRTVEPGTLLSLELHRNTEQAGHTILACVVHVTPQTDGRLALGCNFIRELTDEELKSLL